jgi:hypothetical protein
MHVDRETLIIMLLFASISFYITIIVDINPFIHAVQVHYICSHYFTTLLPLPCHILQHSAYLILHVFSIYELLTPIPKLQPV